MELCGGVWEGGVKCDVRGVGEKWVMLFYHQTDYHQNHYHDNWKQNLHGTHYKLKRVFSIRPKIVINTTEDFLTRQTSTTYT